MRKWLLLACVLVGIGAFGGRPNAQAPAAAFHAVGDLPGGGATTIIRDATSAGGVIYAVGSAATILLGCGFPGSAPCAGPDTPILWRFDGVNPATLEALPGIDPGVTGFPGIGTGNGASDITPDGRYVTSQARKAVAGGFAPRPVRVDTSLLPSSSANLDLNTTFSPALAVAATALATSSDGTIVYGNGPVGGVTRAIRFDTTGATSLFIPLLGTDTQNNVAARGVSTDGTVVVGASIGGGFPHAYRYEHGSGVSAIPTLPGGTFNTPLAVSPDGDLVLLSGNSAANPNLEAYLWRASTNAIQPLGSPNAAFRTGGRLCANDICNPTIQNQGGMTADGSVVAMNFTTPPPTLESGHAYFHNAHGWFHLASVLGANGVDIGAGGWQNLVITGMSSDGTLVFGAGEHNGVVEGFVAEFGAGVLASFNPQAAPPVSTALVGVWAGCEANAMCDFTHPVDADVVFTADGAYYEIEASGFERGYYTYDGSVLTVTTLLDTNGTDGFSSMNGASLGPIVVAGDTIVPGGPIEGIRFPGSIAEPLVGAWVNGNPTLPDSSFVAVFLGGDSGNRYFTANDNPDFGGDGVEVGTYTWEAVTHQLDLAPFGGTPDVGNFATPAPDGLSLHLLGDDGEEFDVARVIDPATIPSITSAPAATGTVGQPLSYFTTASNTVTFGAAGLPGGLSINSSTGAVSGTPGVGGQFAVTITATSAVGVSDIETLTLTIAIPTPVGQNVVVVPEVPEGQGPVTLTFGEITSEGTTTVTVVDPSEVPPPGNVDVGGVIYEVTTTATYQGLITLCFSYAGIDFGTATPRLFHYENSQWVDITTSVDTNTQTICGATTSLSPFAVLVSHVVRTGFYAPVNPIAGVLNTVKGGSTVPLKFNVFVNGVEQTTTAGLVMTQQMISCDSSAPQDDVEPAAVTGGTSLRYAGGQFIQNWKVPKTAGCYMVRMTTVHDGLALTARFKVK